MLDNMVKKRTIAARDLGGPRSGCRFDASYGVTVIITALHMEPTSPSNRLRLSSLTSRFTPKNLLL